MKEKEKALTDLIEEYILLNYCGFDELSINPSYGSKPGKRTHSNDYIACSSTIIIPSTESSFQEHLFTLIDKYGLDEVEVYKNAFISRQVFSNIRGNKNYTSRKKTVLALCLSMKLNIDDTKDLLSKAGYSLSRSLIFDLIIECCIVNNIYDINTINEELFKRTNEVIV